MTSTTTTVYKMKLERLQISSLQVCFGVVIATLIFAVIPAHSQVVQKHSTKNKLCGDDRLYFNKTRKCYPAEEKGPCGELMALQPSIWNKSIGECKCVFIKGELLCAQRPKVFWEEESRCYYIYDQGPCKAGNWLVPQKDGPPTCERIPCLEKYNGQFKDTFYKNGLAGPTASGRFVFPHQGKCYESYSEEMDFCPPKQYAYFRGDDSFNLYCSEHIVCGVSYTPGTRCPDGSDPDFQGGCEPPAEI